MIRLCSNSLQVTMILRQALHFSLLFMFASAKNGHRGLRVDRKERDLMAQDENLPSISTLPIDILATKQTLGVCEGKCFQDKDCEGNLVCFKRSFPNKPVPGCLGGEDDLTLSNYCADPEAFTDAPTQAPTQSPSISPTLSQAPSPYGELEYTLRFPGLEDLTINLDPEPKALRGNSIQMDICPPLLFYGADPPATAFPLGLCEGDCDNDADCRGDLICYQREEAFQNVPGCRNGDRDPSKSDYCTYK